MPLTIETEVLGMEFAMLYLRPAAPRVHASLIFERT